jgi:hypothetical protein
MIRLIWTRPTTGDNHRKREQQHMTYAQFILDSSDDPDELLEAAARLTLRLALRCEWVE